MLDAAGHDVTVLDEDGDAFRRLGSQYRGRAVEGSGLEEEVLRQANVGEADVFVALTGGDNRNIMACQLAKLAFGVPHVICQVKDPIRGETYAALGITPICPTLVGVEAVRAELGDGT